MLHLGFLRTRRKRWRHFGSLGYLPGEESFSTDDYTGAKAAVVLDKGRFRWSLLVLECRRAMKYWYE